MFFGFKHIMYIIMILSSFNIIECFNFINLINRRTFLTNSLTSSVLFNIQSNANNSNKKIILLDEDNNEDYYSALQILKKNNNIRANNNIYFTGLLTDESCYNLAEALIHHKNLALTDDKYPPYINLYIQSPGGSLLPTLAIVDEIKNLEIPVYTYIRGYAASAATLLSVSGSQRFMYKNSLAMIHGIKLNEQEPGTLLEVKDLNENVNTFMSIIKNIYLENTNINEETLENYFYHDLWMNSTQALEYGLVDIII